MKHRQQIFLVALVILILGSFLYSLQLDNSEANSIHNTYQYSTYEVNGSSFDIAKITHENIGTLTFNYKDKSNQRFSTISNLKEQKGELIFATNGGIFSKTYEPLGLYIENGSTISNINTHTGEGNFYLQPNGIFLIKAAEANIIETKKYQDQSAILFAIQSGPLLVIDNKIHPSFNQSSQNKYVRSGVGIDQEGSVIFAISNQPVTFYEFASLFRNKLKCKNALYLDGAISEMYVPKFRENTEEKFSVMIGIVGK